VTWDSWLPSGVTDLNHFVQLINRGFLSSAFESGQCGELKNIFL
jgi:hypothetical protein